jgi:ubiquinol-cytochrome c reductase cytochrome b subunit
VYEDTELPSAYASLVRLTYDVPVGDIFRRIHRFSAHVFLGAIVLHGARIFLTGAFRKPREVNYVVGILLLLLGIGAGFTGQILPYDVIAGITLRITYSFLLSIPYVGPQLAFWVFGGEFLTADVLYRMYVMHVLIIPGLIAAVVSVHLALLVRQRHTQLPHERLDGQRMIVGTPLWPWQFVVSNSLFLLVVLPLLFLLFLQLFDPPVDLLELAIDLVEADVVLCLVDRLHDSVDLGRRHAGELERLERPFGQGPAHAVLPFHKNITLAL